ncbi:hypothetical protein CCR75_005939 [Bremia lactucae]|uniref:Uncharacterized protein n=1 Tax=Bremia lactucae TaxID=4779 RepID=A0A976ICR5_BRELC|nr:hypothetical protein CCR75_005939 [Bremia lactucae]
MRRKVLFSRPVGVLEVEQYAVWYLSLTPNASRSGDLGHTLARRCFSDEQLQGPGNIAVTEADERRLVDWATPLSSLEETKGIAADRLNIHCEKGRQLRLQSRQPGSVVGYITSQHLPSDFCKQSLQRAADKARL